MPSDPLPLAVRDVQHVVELWRFTLRQLPEIAQLDLKRVPTVIDTDGRNSTGTGHGDLH